MFFFSTHQWPWYPGSGDVSETGQGKGLGATLNQPLPAGSGRDELVGAFAQRLLPIMDRFRPELVMISAGFDSAVGDPLGQFMLTDDDFAELTRMVMNVASDYAEGRVVSVLEGGYSLPGLGKCAVAAHVEAADPVRSGCEASDPDSLAHWSSCCLPEIAADSQILLSFSVDWRSLVRQVRVDVFSTSADAKGAYLGKISRRAACEY